MAPSLKKVLDWLFLGVKLSTGCCCPSFSISQSLEHVHVVAGISWIRVMCWNTREPRPHLTYLLASVANFVACLSKMHAKAPVCFNFFNFHPVCTKYPMNIEHIILILRSSQGLESRPLNREILYNPIYYFYIIIIHNINHTK
jgi:hypothetical protein